MQLGGYRIRGDVFVVRWERVARQAEGTDPETGSNIHLAREKSAQDPIYVHSHIPEWVQHRSAWRFADHRLEM